MKFPVGSSLGFFGVFGRSTDLRLLDDSFRKLDVHPRTVPEAVKLAILRLVRDGEGPSPGEASFRRAAEIVGYCMIGANAYGAGNGDAALDGVERRMENALLVGTSLDAQLILLALHAKVVQPSVVDAFELESAER